MVESGPVQVVGFCRNGAAGKPDGIGRIGSDEYPYSQKPGTTPSKANAVGLEVHPQAKYA